MKKPMSNRTKTYILMILPALILFIAFNTIPLITGAFYSLTNYRGYGSYDFVGLRNFKDLFQDSRIGKSYLFTFKYAICGTILVNVLSLILALGLNSKIKFRVLSPILLPIQVSCVINMAITAVPWELSSATAVTDSSSRWKTGHSLP